MNKIIGKTWKKIFFLSLAVLPYAGAQEFAEETPLPPPPRERPPPESVEFAEPPGPPPGPEGPVDIWMGRLQKRNPEEFRRFQHMRRQDPEGFRKELRNRLGRERIEAGMAAHPRLRAFLESLPEPERLEIVQALSRAFRPEGPLPPHEPESPALQFLRDEIERLAGECRQSGDREQRQKLQAELRVKLGEMFDAREKERARHIERIQSELAKLQQRLQSRRERREEIIERRLRELTEEETLRW